MDYAPLSTLPRRTLPRRAFLFSLSLLRNRLYFLSGNRQAVRRLGVLLVLRVPRRARKRDRVADVGEPGDVRHRPLEAEPEPGVRHRAVAAEVPIPAVAVLVESALGHARIEDVQPLLALAAADDRSEEHTSELQSLRHLVCRRL